MSVICFSQEELVNTREGVKNNRNALNALPYTPGYKKYSLYRDAKQDEEAFRASIVDRLFWYLTISNRIAYQLNYQDERVDLLAWDEAKEAPSKVMRGYDLLRGLDSLKYNLATNDGNMFIDAGWLETFEAVRDAVANWLIRAAYDQPEPMPQFITD